jgi:hypothetical protein
MKVTPRLLKLDDVAAVIGIELDESDENFAGGSMQALLERLKRGPDPQAHHPFLVIVEREVVGFGLLPVFRTLS